MEPENRSSRPACLEALESQAQKAARDFFRALNLPRPDSFKVTVFETQTAYQARSRATGPGPVNIDLQKGRASVHLDGESLSGIPPQALAGWVDLELILARMKQSPDQYQFNFSRQFLPRFNVTGSAVFYLRQMVEYMHRALLRRMAVQELIAAGLGERQVQSLFFRLGSDPFRKSDYECSLDHNWQRSFFVFELLQEFMTADLLDRSGLAVGFRSMFWEDHGYVIRTDRELILKMAEIPIERESQPYSAQLVAMFEIAKSDLIGRQGIERRSA